MQIDILEGGQGEYQSRQHLWKIDKQILTNGQYLTVVAATESKGELSYWEKGKVIEKREERQNPGHWKEKPLHPSPYIQICDLAPAYINKVKFHELPEWQKG